MSTNTSQPATTGTATSRANQRRPAIRKPTKARLAISGPSGSGKTWTALSIAQVLAPGGAITLIDSEPSDDMNSAAELYADVFAFDIIDWRLPPYDPRDLALTIRDLGNQGQTDVLIVDSGSPFWRGAGGTLDIADGRFGGWKTATPAQDDLIAAILNAPCHIIFCTRAKQSYEVEQGNDGKQQVRKLGLAPIQRDDLEYEFQVVMMIDVEHRIDIGKTRCQDVAGLSFPANKQADFAVIYKGWLDRGLQIIRAIDADLIRAATTLPQQRDKVAEVRRTFRDTFGVLDNLEVDQLGAAWLWLADAVDVEPHPFTPSTQDEHACAVCTLGRRAGWHSGEDAPAAPPVRRTAPAMQSQAITAESAPEAPERPQSAPTAQAGNGQAAAAQPEADEQRSEIDVCGTCSTPIYRETPEWLWHHADDPQLDDMHAPEPAVVPAVAEQAIDNAVIERVDAVMKGLTHSKIVTALKRHELSVNGTPKVLRQRLRDAYLMDPALLDAPVGS